MKIFGARGHRSKCAVCLLSALAAASVASAGTIVGSGTPTTLGNGKLQVVEQGSAGQAFLVYPMWTDKDGHTHRFVNGDGSEWSAGVKMDTPVPGKDGAYQGTVTVPYQHSSSGTTHKVTSYQQTTGDPGTLYAAVFAGGVMLDSIEDWFDANIPEGQEIVQPDFNLVGGGDLFYGVNLADLITAGTTFSNAHNFGDIFTIGAGGTLPELPMYVFSSTPLDYVAGTGWIGTPLTPGTQVFYNAAHITSTVPEPESWMLMAIGCVFAIVGKFRRWRPVSQI